MSKVDIELNSTNIQRFLQGESVRKMLSNRAELIRRRAGNGYGTDTKLMPTRYIASVFTDSAETLHDNFENNTLLKAVGGFVH